MIVNPCEHIWKKYTDADRDMRAGSIEATFRCEKCKSVLSASDVFRIEALSNQEKNHREILDNQNTYNTKQLYWSRVLAISTILLVLATLSLVIAE